MSVETQVAITLYYLADGGKMTKISNSFGLGLVYVNLFGLWPGSIHYTWMFGDSALSGMFRDGTIPKCERIIVEGGPAVPVCILGDPAYPLLPILMKEFSKVRKNSSERFFGQRLSSARMVIECTVGQLKARFGCLRREMDINL